MMTKRAAMQLSRRVAGELLAANADEVDLGVGLDADDEIQVREELHDLAKALTEMGAHP